MILKSDILSFDLCDCLNGSCAYTSLKMVCSKLTPADFDIREIYAEALSSSQYYCALNGYTLYQETDCVVFLYALT